MIGMSSPAKSSTCRTRTPPAGKGQAYLEVHQLFDSISALHAQMHALADRLLEWKNAGRQAEALAALAEFRALDIQLLAMLDQFAHARHGH